MTNFFIVCLKLHTVFISKQQHKKKQDFEIAKYIQKHSVSNKSTNPTDSLHKCNKCKMIKNCIGGCICEKTKLHLSHRNAPAGFDSVIFHYRNEDFTLSCSKVKELLDATPNPICSVYVGMIGTMTTPEGMDSNCRKGKLTCNTKLVEEKRYADKGHGLS